VDTTLKAESILLEEFHRANITTYQVSDEISSTFNFYLVATGLVATGIPAIVGFLAHNTDATLYSKSQGSTNELFLVLIIGFMVILGIANYSFSMRFDELTKEYDQNVAIMEKVKKFYIDHLKLQIDLEQILSETERDRKMNRVPVHIRVITAVSGSFYLSFSAYIFSEFLINSVYNYFNFNRDIYWITVFQLIISAFVFSIVFTRYGQLYSITLLNRRKMGFFGQRPQKVK